MPRSLNQMYMRITKDIKHIHETFGILTVKQLEMLTRDIQYVFMDNIAREIRLCFYDPENKDKIYSEFIYTNKGHAEIKGNISIRQARESLAFDVFIEFTDAFQSTDRVYREILLNNTELDWFT